MQRLAKVPLGVRILLGLLLGVTLASVIPSPGAAEWSDKLVGAAHVGGQLWLAALQMTVLPLVFALLTTGLARSARATDERSPVARRAVGTFAVLYLLSVVLGVILNVILLHFWPVSDASSGAFRKFAGDTVQANVPRVDEVILSLVPSNVFAALAAGAILPVVVFAILFGLAMRRLDSPKRKQIDQLIATIADVMFTIVGWILALAPLGAFGLVIATAHETGIAMLWGLAGYLRHMLTVHIVMMALSYPVAVFWGRSGFARFAAAAAPSQLVAASTQSSVGSLPVMLESAKKLHVSDDVASVTLPLAVSVFRFSGPAGTLSVAAYAAAAGGLSPTFGALALAALLALLMEFAAVGLPNQVNLVAISAPVFAALGAPLGFLPVMLAVDSIPDALGTTGNVSMDLAATTVVGREHVASSG